MKLETLRKSSAAELENIANAYDLPFTTTEDTIKRICDAAGLVYVRPDADDIIDNAESLPVPYIFGLTDSDDIIKNTRFTVELVARIRINGLIKSGGQMSKREKAVLIATYFLGATKQHRIAETILTVQTLMGVGDSRFHAMRGDFNHPLRFAIHAVNILDANEFEALFQRAAMKLAVDDVTENDDEFLEQGGVK